MANGNDQQDQIANLMKTISAVNDEFEKTYPIGNDPGDSVVSFIAGLANTVTRNDDGSPHIGIVPLIANTINAKQEIRSNRLEAAQQQFKQGLDALKFVTEQQQATPQAQATKAFFTTFAQEEAQSRFRRDDPVKRASDSLDFSKRFEALPEVEDYKTIKSQVAIMDELLGDLQTGKITSLNFVDQPLITLFNKITDPRSVVRETEYGRTGEGQSVERRLPGMIAKLRAGGAGLSQEERLDLVKAAKAIANARGEAFNESFDRFSKISSKAFLDPEIALGGLQRHEKIDVLATNQFRTQIKKNKKDELLSVGSISNVGGVNFVVRKLRQQ